MLNSKACRLVTLVLLSAAIPSVAWAECCRNYEEFAAHCRAQGGNPSPNGPRCDSPPQSGSASTNEGPSAVGTAIGQALGTALGQALNGWLRGNPERQAKLDQRLRELERRREQEARARAEADSRRREEIFNRLNGELEIAGLPGVYLKGITNPQGLRLKGFDPTAGATGELKMKIGDDATKPYGIPGLPGIYTGGPRAADAGSGSGSTAGQSDKPLVLRLGDEATKPTVSAPGISGLPGIYLNGPQQPAVGIQRAQQLARSAEQLSGPERELAEAAALDAAGADPDLVASSDESVRTFKQADEQYDNARDVQARASEAFRSAQGQHEAALAVLDVAETQFQDEKAVNRDPVALEGRRQELSQLVASASTDEAAWRIAKEQFETATADVTVKRSATIQALRGVSADAPSSPPSSARPPVPATPIAPIPTTGPAVGRAMDFSYLYALQTRTLTAMPDGGHPLDAAGSPPVGLHGLVGGTTWTYGFRRPYVKCEQNCKDEIDKKLKSQLSLFCSSQSDPKTCLQEGLPFTPDMYDFVVSMGSSHAAIEDLATRVLFDGATFGEFSRQNKEIFASLTGRAFETLDCHSNGALICLAALRSGDTTAKEVRLFGPQMSPEAAKRWQEYSANTGTKIKIYINHGDPVAAISWKQPTPQTPLERAASAAWLLNPVTGPAALADALSNTYWDSKKDVMGPILRSYGFDVTRWTCKDLPSIDCHSMKLYEDKLLHGEKAVTVQ
jgi:hypothetical protein